MLNFFPQGFFYADINCNDYLKESLEINEKEGKIYQIKKIFQ